MPPKKSNLSIVSTLPPDTNNRPAIPSTVPPPMPASAAIGPSHTSSKSMQQIPSQTKAEKKTGHGADSHAHIDGGKESEKTKVSKKAKDEKGIEDLLLPRTLISRLSRGSLPPNTSLQKDALLALTKSATVFISYLAHTANSVTSRKTIQAQDVLEAIREMELDGVMGTRLEDEVKLFEEGVKGKRKGYRDRVKARESGAGEDSLVYADEEMAREHEAKRVKRNGDDGDVSMRENGVEEDEEDEEEDGPSAQLEAEAAMANDDQTEAEDDQDEEDEDDDNDDENDEEDEDDDGEEDEGDGDGLGRGMRNAEDPEDTDRSIRPRGLLGPHGEVAGSDEESE